MDESCLFCLENMEQSNKEVLPLFFFQEVGACSCRINSHFDCWMSYYIFKGHFECPICHFKLIQMPPSPPRSQAQNITIISENRAFQINVPASETPIRITLPPVEESRRNRITSVKLCMLLSLIIGICMTVYYYRT